MNYLTKLLKMTGFKGIIVKTAIFVPLVFVGVSVFQATQMDSAQRLHQPSVQDTAMPLATQPVQAELQREPAGVSPSQTPQPSPKAGSVQH